MKACRGTQYRGHSWQGGCERLGTGVGPLTESTTCSALGLTLEVWVFCYIESSTFFSSLKCIIRNKIGKKSLAQGPMAGK